MKVGVCVVVVVGRGAVVVAAGPTPVSLPSLCFILFCLVKNKSSHISYYSTKQ